MHGEIPVLERIALGERGNVIQKYLNYLIFGGIVLVVVGLAALHSHHMHQLLYNLTHGTPAQRAAAAKELIAEEQFSDTIAGEPKEMRAQAAIALADLGNADAVKQAVQMLKDQDKIVRDQALRTLKQIGAASADNIKALVDGLSDSDINVRQGVIRALTDPDGIGPRQNPDVVQALINELKSSSDARGPVGDVLSSKTFDPAANNRSVPALMALLDDKDDGVKVGAANALGKIGDPQAVPKLIAVLQNPAITTQVRTAVIAAIGLIAAPSSEPVLAKAVLDPSVDSDARAQAAAGLGRIATPDAISTLLKALTDYDLNLRTAAISALSVAARPGEDSPPNRAVVQQLIKALSSPQKEIRLGVAQALIPVRDPETDPALARLLQTDTQDADVRAAAAKALGFSGNRGGIAPLVAALNDPSGTVAEAATQALAQIGPAAAPTLISLLAKGGTTAYYASTALGELLDSDHGHEILMQLATAVKSANPTLQRWAAVALGNTDLAGAKDILEQLAKSSDADVAYVAQQQLNRFEQAQ